MDQLIQPLRTGSAVALALAVVVLGIGWRVWRRGKPVAGGGWSVALALGGAYVVGHLIIGPWPLWPTEAIKWLLWVAAAATALGLLDSLVPWPAWLRWPLRVLVAAAVLWLVFGKLIANRSPDLAGRVEWFVGLSAAVVLFWWLLDDQAERWPGASVPVILLPVVGASVPILLFWSGTYLAAFLLVPLLTALVVCLAVACWNPLFSLARGGTSVVALVVPTVWLIGYFLADLKPLPAALLAAAPAAAWLSRVGPFRRLGPWTAVLVRGVLVLIPVAVALKLAYDGRPPEQPPDPYGY